MEDFFRRHGITPLVSHAQMDAGKRVLQRVCLEAQLWRSYELCWCECVARLSEAHTQTYSAAAQRCALVLFSLQNQLFCGTRRSLSQQRASLLA